MSKYTVFSIIFVADKERTVLQSAGEVVALIQVAVMLCSVVYVEYSLRRNFYKNGERKNDWER